MSTENEKLRQASLSITAGLSLNTTLASEVREAIRHAYMQDLKQLESELAAASAIAQGILAPANPLELGTDHIDKGRYDEAFQVLTGALRSKTATTPIPAILFQLGRLASLRRLDEDARELFYQAASRDVELTRKIVDFYMDQVARARSERQ